MKKNTLFEGTILDGVECIVVDGKPEFVKFLNTKEKGVDGEICMADHYVNVFNNAKYHIAKHSYDDDSCKILGCRTLPKDTAYLSIVKYLTSEDIDKLVEETFKDADAIDINKRMIDDLCGKGPQR